MTAPNFTLSSGREVTHRRMDNGAQEVFATTGPNELTDEEWDEYCQVLRKWNSERIQQAGPVQVSYIHEYGLKQKLSQPITVY